MGARAWFDPKGATLRPLVAVAFWALVIASTSHVHRSGEALPYHCALTVAPILPASPVAADAEETPVIEFPSPSHSLDNDRAEPLRTSLPRGPPLPPCGFSR